MPKGKRVRRNEREHKTGSIKEIRPGVFRAWRPPVPHPSKPGKTYRASEQFEGDAARDRAEAWLKGVEQGPSMSLGFWCEIWCGRRFARLRPNTRTNYERAFGLLASLLGRPIGSITVDEWQATIDQLLTQATRTSVQVTRSIWSAAMTGAVRAGLLRANPILETGLPRRIEAAPTAWRREQIHRLLAAARGHHHEAWLHLGFATGLRGGELRALEWDDVDLVALTVTVSKSLDNKTDEEGPTKSGRLRVVDLPEETAELLAAHAKRQPPGSTLVCGRPHGPRGKGGAYGAQTYRDWLRRLCASAGVPPHTPHAMRHTFASTAIEEGVPLTALADALGHADVTTTGRIYAHFLERQARRTARAVGRALYAKNDDLHRDLHAEQAATR